MGRSPTKNRRLRSQVSLKKITQRFSVVAEYFVKGTWSYMAAVAMYSIGCKKLTRQRSSPTANVVSDEVRLRRS